MSLIKETSDYFQERGYGTVGSTIYRGELPASAPDNAILLVTAPSDAPDMYLETQYLTIDVWCRNKSTQAAYDTLENIFKGMHRRANFDLTSYYVYFVHATGDIVDFEKDAQKRKLLKLSLRFIYRNKSLIS